jgi:MOSC domain-containing protein YiiM
MSALKLLSVNVGMLREVDWHGKLVRTSIFKSPMLGPIRVATLNLEGR